MRPPSVDVLARSLADTGLPHAVLVECARRAVAEHRDDAERVARVEAEAVADALLRPVINATGVLLHTNLGRAPVAHTQKARYTNLEFDVATGTRGSRNERTAALVAVACSAPSALIVNNGAAAVLLVLTALAADHEVLVSRGEAVEIGGGFRVPEIMAQSGARLVDVGTTNRTRLDDFTRAMTPATALTLKVHPSNYRVEGFTEQASVAELASLPVPLVADIGSGLLDANCPWLPGAPPAWLNGEMAARQTLADGAALVCFSGDKLYGGPQAGIIAGRADLVAMCAQHPLARALRCGSLVLAALAEVTLAYLRRDGTAIPFWKMVTTTTDELRARARAIGIGEIVETEAVPGAGSVPGVTIASIGLRLDGDHVMALRRGNPPIIARARDGSTFIDLRSIAPDDDDLVGERLRALAL